MEWISVKDRLPSKGEGVLVTDGEVVTAAELDYSDGEPWWWDGHGFGGYEWSFDFSENFSAGEITHWMPLPPPPLSSPQPSMTERRTDEQVGSSTMNAIQQD